MSPGCRAGIAGLFFALSTVAGATQVLSGRFDDPGNAALSDSQLGAPLFGDDNDVAQNVALYDITVGQYSLVTFTSTGFAGGGANPYFSLFAGSGLGATFVGSNYAIATDTGGDFTLNFNLAAGSYQVALGVYTNMSFAENYGSGTLGDGFVQIGDPSELGNASYALSISQTAASPAPELPATAMLALGLGAMAWLGRARRRDGCPELVQ